MRALFIACGLTVALSSTAMAALAGNPPQINYVQTLNAHDKPQSYFHRGSTVELRLRLYLTDQSAIGRVVTTWRVVVGRSAIMSRSRHNGFTGPSRGDLFVQTQHLTLSRRAPAGTYTVHVTVQVEGRHLADTFRFWVR